MPSIEISRLAARHCPSDLPPPARLSDHHECLHHRVRFEAGDEGRASSGGVVVPERRQAHA